MDGGEDRSAARAGSRAAFCGRAGLVLALVAVAASARGDAYVLKSGDRFRGGPPEMYVVEKTSWMRVRAAFGEVRFRKSELKTHVKTRSEDGPVRVEQIIVTTVKGTVEKSADGKSWTAVRWPVRDPKGSWTEGGLPINAPNAWVAPGDRIRTAEGAEIDLDVGWGVVHVTERSEVVFDPAGAATMRVDRGAAGASLPSLPADGEFRVETPQSSMGVRGTVFAVVVGQATRVAVAEGTVDLGGLLLHADETGAQAAGAAPAPTEAETADQDLLDRTRRTVAVPRIDFVRVPAGKFTMGVRSGGGAGMLGNSATYPEHVVRLPAFEMSRTEITNAQYAIFARWIRETGDHTFCHPLEPADSDHQPLKAMNGAPLAERFRGDDQPVCGIDWYSAYAFAAWAGVELPSEAEWEYAARAGTTTLFPWGPTEVGFEKHEWWERNCGDAPWDPNQPPPEVAAAWGEVRERWLAEMREKFNVRPRPVGTLPANAFGLHDMMGNVSEFCRDYVHETYDGAPDDGSPWLDTGRLATLDGAPGRIGRGESWMSASTSRNVFERQFRPPGRAEDSFGIRVVRRSRR